jgi:transposase-like protein
MNNYQGEPVTCPHCGGDQVEFLGNEDDKSWFKCIACTYDVRVFSKKLAERPRFAYEG